MITNYSELPIREEMKKAIAEMGFTEMTEIQQKAIPELLAGKEVIAKAPTGTGKTCAFGVPMVQRIQPEKGYVQGVILCPTRELCLQITEELQKLGKYIPAFPSWPCMAGSPCSRRSTPSGRTRRSWWLPPAV